MRTRGWLVAGVAGALSAGLHAGGLVGLAPPETEMLAGGPARLAMIGNSFEDAVAGTIISATTAGRIGPGEAAPPEISHAVPATATSPLSPVSPATTVAAPVLHNAEPVVPAPVDTITPVQTSAASTPVTRPATNAARAAVLEKVTAHDAPVARTADAATPRPQPRAARTEPYSVPPAGATETTRAGDAQGVAQGTASRTQQGAGGSSVSDGRAAERYPQLVNSHLARLRRPNARFDGAAVIAFTIAGNGGLRGLSVARSSGNAGFDRLALAHIQRAAPFPPPPAGAQRDFNVTVRGR